jgi:hypothetical protein
MGVLLLSYINRWPQRAVVYQDTLLWVNQPPGQGHHYSLLSVELTLLLLLLLLLEITASS